MAENEVDGTPPEVLLAQERALILGARDNPAGTKIPGTEKTVAEFRRERRVTHMEEETKQAAVEGDIARKASVRGDPLYTEQTEVVFSPEGLGSLTLGAAGAVAAGEGDGANGGQGGASGGATDKTADPPANDLPDAIPFKAELLAAGQTVYAELRAKSQNFIEGLPGIGREKARTIKAFIDADE